MYRKFFLIPILTCVFAVTLATNSMARIQPYIGLGINSLDVKSEVDYGVSTAFDTQSYNGITGNYNFGIILNDHRKLNFTYLKASQKSTQEGAYNFSTSLIGLSFDHCFNNYGEHKGFYVGAGLARITTTAASTPKPEDKSEMGFLAKVGFEHKTDDNILLDLSYNISRAETSHAYYYNGQNVEGKGMTTVSYVNLTLNFLF